MLALLLLACEFTPNHVTITDIDNALARGRYETMCVGLVMTDDDVRKHATDRLIALQDPDGIETATECICANIADEKQGWDRSIAAGLKGATNDAQVACFAELVKNPDLEDRADAIAALGATKANSGREALLAIATGEGDPVVRAAALAKVGHYEANLETTLKLLAEDKAPEVRAAAAASLFGLERKVAIVEALEKATADGDAAVRASALAALQKMDSARAEEKICKAMLEDPDAGVRKAAVESVRGTKRASTMECLRSRAMTREDDAGVRDALLETLKKTPHPESAKILCDAIPFWMRTYVTEDLPEKTPGTQIAEAQNERDWNGSFECMKRAYQSSGGYSCYARMYTAWWFQKVGGEARIPPCPPKYPASK